MYQSNNQNKEINGQQEQNDVYQPIPMYGQVQGQKIYMGGLDYSLLQKQKQQDNKKGFLDILKSQLSSMQKKIDSRVLKPQEKHRQLDPQSIKLIQSIKLLSQGKPLVNSSTYYVFDTRYHFGLLRPQIVTKRMGRMSKQSSYIRIGEGTITKFRDLLLNKSKAAGQIRNKQKQLKRLLRTQGQQQSQDQSINSEDDIFGDNSQEQHNQADTPKLFNFGAKLNLGVKDDQIFMNKEQGQPRLSPQREQQLIQQPEKDKYQFLRKKVKKATNQQQDDGYGQCYFQTGPTFDQMKQYRSQGVQIWGDLKQFPKKPERKANIHRQYDQVKRIIDQKSKKK